MWKVGLKIVLSVATIFLVFREINFHLFFEYLLNINRTLYVAAIGLQIISSLIAAYKWDTIMSFMGYQQPYRFYAKTYLIGTMFNQILPTSVGGDAVRIGYTSKLDGGLKKAFYGVMADRYYGTVGLVLINILPLFWLVHTLPHHIFLVILGITVFVGAGLVFAPFLSKIHFFKKFKFTRTLYELSQAIMNSATDLPHITLLLVLAMASNLMTILATYMIACSLFLNVSLLDLLGIMPAITLITLLPISFAGWGIREGAMVTFLLFLGLPKAAILSLSILYGIMLILSSLPGLYFYIFKRSGK
jgi:uncharacterized protein (TIRG00374 family)